ncbi:MAG: cyclodeaminase [Aestuariivirga sp.]
MGQIRILAEADLRRAVTLDLQAVSCIEAAFLALASKAVSMPPILRLDIPEHRGEVDVKTAYIPGVESFAIKVSPGFFNNPSLGLPSLNGLMMLFSSRTGIAEAALFDNGYLTAIRTAAAGAVAARHLSRQDSSVAAILGAGEQARLQLKALMLVRPIAHARLWARDPSKAGEAASRLAEELGLDVQSAASAEAAVRDADIIVTTTPAEQPILFNNWLSPGQHVTAMGSDAEHKNEIDPEIIASADLYVADSVRQTRILGELHHAVASGLVAADAQFSELGQVIRDASARPFRDAITVCDLTGTGAQDTAIATFAMARARQSNSGTNFNV